jgi:predicted transcriptional regulator
MAVSAKQAALKVIESMPEDASLEEVMYELYFRKRVDRGLRELEEGKTISHAEIKRSLAKWLQSAGQ